MFYSAVGRVSGSTLRSLRPIKKLLLLLLLLCIYCKTDYTALRWSFKAGLL